MGNMIGPAGTSCAIAYIMYIWYRPIMGEYGMTGQYHLCDHIHYVYLVPADHGEYDRTSQYQLCDCIHYVYLVPADHGGIWYDRPVPFVRSHPSRISVTGRSWGIWYDWPVPVVRSHTLCIFGTGRSWGIWYDQPV